MGRPCSHNGRRQNCVQNFNRLTYREKIFRKAGREDSITMNLKEIDDNTRKWVDLAQDKDYWRAVVNVALFLRVP
jgi:hypothetical protein